MRALAVVAVLFPGVAAAQTNLEAVNVSVPAEAVAGGTLAVTAAVRTDPALTGATWSLHLTSGGVVAGARTLGPFPLPAPSVGRTVRIEQPVPLPADATGVYRVVLGLDVANAIAETTELDNLVSAPADTRIRARAPNLRIAGLSPAGSRHRPGDAFELSFTVQNTGEVDAASEVVAYLSRDDQVTTADPVLGSAPVTVAAGGQAVGTLSAQIPADAPAGARVLGLIADPQGQVVEVSEVDNVGVLDGPFTVFEDDLTLATADLLDATAGQPYHAALRATGGDGAYVFRVASGALPDGLALSPAGVLAGTPTRSGDFAFRIEVSSDGRTDGRDYTVDVRRSAAPVTIVTEQLAPGFLNMPYEQALVAGGGEPPYSWSIASGNLPAGLDLSPAGLITGVPTALGTFRFTVSAQDRLGARAEMELEARVTSANNVIVLLQRPAPLPVGQPVDIQLEAAGGSQPYEWTALSISPPGLSLSEQGRITGTPTEVGSWPLLVRVDDASRAGASDTALIPLEVVDGGDFEISTDTLPVGIARERYEVILEAEGGEPPLVWSLSPGSRLPPDFFLVNGDGVEAPVGAARLYGLPLVAGVHAFTVRVEDAFGRRREMTYALTVERPRIQLDEGGCRGAPAGDASLALLGLLGLGLLRSRGGRRTS